MGHTHHLTRDSSGHEKSQLPVAEDARHIKLISPKQMARSSFRVSGGGVQKPRQGSQQGSRSAPKSRAEKLSLLSNSDYFPKTQWGLCDTLDE